MGATSSSGNLIRQNPMQNAKRFSASDFPILDFLISDSSALTIPVKFPHGYACVLMGVYLNNITLCYALKSSLLMKTRHFLPPSLYPYISKALFNMKGGKRKHPISYDHC
jgi:hypothetical protein